MILPLLLLSAAVAGDPCPIALRFAEVTPPWRDRSADLGALQRQQTWFGVTYTGRTTGVVITALGPNSPAQAAGLQVGDRITTLNGRPVGTKEQANAAFDATPPGGPAVFVVERDGSPREVAVQPGPADPLLMGLVATAHAQRCRDVALSGLTPAQTQAALQAAFTDQRGFRCTDAHRGLSGFPDGAVLLVRGGRRVLLVQPGTTSTCVGVDTVDGDALTAQRLEGLLDKVAGPYIQDRHDNP